MRRLELILREQVPGFVSSARRKLVNTVDWNAAGPAKKAIEVAKRKNGSKWQMKDRRENEHSVVNPREAHALVTQSPQWAHTPSTRNCDPSMRDKSTRRKSDQKTE